jgi:hypothetical protein
MKKQIFLIALVFIFIGCLKEPRSKIEKLRGLKWSGTYAAAVVDADLNLNDAVELVTGLVQGGTYGDGTLYLAYEEMEFSKYGYELVTVPNQSENSTYELSSGEEGQLASGSFTKSLNFNWNFSVNGMAQTDSIWMDRGQIAPVISNRYNHPCSGVAIFPDLLVQGQPLTVNFTIPANGTYSTAASILGSHIDLSKTNPFHNQFRMQASITWTNSGFGFSPSDGIDLGFAASNMVFNRVFGTMGTVSLLNASDSIEISLFQNNLPSNVNFEDPKLKISISNNTGLPLSLEPSNLQAHYESLASQTITGAPAALNISGVSYNNAGSTLKDSIVLDKNNSNIKGLVNNQPQYISYSVQVTGNKFSNPKVFVSSDSRVAVKVALELPFHGSSNGLTLEDTVDFDAGSVDGIEIIDWLNMRLQVKNEIPLSLGVQAYFLDAQNKILDSLFQPYRQLIEAAKVDASGNVTAAYEDLYDIEFNKPKINAILQAKKLKFKVIAPTALYNGSSVPIKISNLQHLKIKVGLHTKLSVNETL